MVPGDMVKSEFILPFIHLCSPISSLKIKDNEKEIHHIRNDERGQGVSWAPILSKISQIRSKTWGNKDQNVAFWGVIFHENTSSKSKFRSKGAE